MKQGFSHLGIAGNTSHHDLVLPRPEDWLGRAIGMSAFAWEGDTPSVSTGDSDRAPDPELTFSRVWDVQDGGVQDTSQLVLGVPQSDQQESRPFVMVGMP